MCHVTLLINIDFINTAAKNRTRKFSVEHVFPYCGVWAFSIRFA